MTDQPAAGPTTAARATRPTEADAEAQAGAQATRPTAAEIELSQQRWRYERRYLNQHRHELTQALAHLYPAEWQVAGTQCLARPEWCPAAPVPLEDVPLTWRPGPLSTEVDLVAPTGSEAVRPWRDDGQRFASYAEAMAALDPPRVLQNRTCYRLLEATATASRRTSLGLTFGPNRYFDLINLSEAVAHETAQQVLRQPEARLDLADLPLRAAIGDPRELARRSAPTGIGTLILRRDRDAGTAQMFLHWRDPARVAVNGGLYQVAPAGMFQPSDEAGWNLANDLSLWRAIAREVSEELLGTSEDYGSDRAPIDYGRWPFFAALTAARQAGTLHGYWLGVGADVLTLDVDLLTVLVFDARSSTRSSAAWSRPTTRATCSRAQLSRAPPGIRAAPVTATSGWSSPPPASSGSPGPRPCSRPAPRCSAWPGSTAGSC